VGANRRLDPVLLSVVGGLVLELDGAVDGLLLSLEVQGAGLAGGGGELLVELGDLLERRVDLRAGVLGLGACCHGGTPRGKEE
jgi:hypothetical protein